MGLLEFDKLPINTLVGADWKTFKAVTANKTIDKGFRNKYFLTKSVCRLLSLLQPFEDARYRKIAFDLLVGDGPGVHSRTLAQRDDFHAQCLLV